VHSARAPHKRPNTSHAESGQGRTLQVPRRLIVCHRSQVTTNLESRELEGTLVDEHAVVVDPPLWPELLGVRAPQELHPAHLVRLVVHHVTFLDSVAVR
jgi:hypothetical protein